MIKKLLFVILQTTLGCLLFCIAASAQEKASSFTLSDGEYSIESTLNYPSREDKIVKSMPATVAVRRSKVLISTSATKPDIRLKPTVGRLVGNKFKAKILLGATVIGEFTGELVENNRIEGVFSYDYFDNRKITGTWTMKLLKF